ncbi:hypothetical protein RUND412_000374 [Rhizina undulata]
MITDGNGVKYTVFHQDQRKPLSLMQKWQELANTPGGPKRFLENNPPIDNEEVKQVQVQAKVATTEKK